MIICGSSMLSDLLPLAILACMHFIMPTKPMHETIKPNSTRTPIPTPATICMMRTSLSLDSSDSVSTRPEPPLSVVADRVSLVLISSFTSEVITGSVPVDDPGLLSTAFEAVKIAFPIVVGSSSGAVSVKKT